MDSNTSELYRALESGPYDQAGLSQVKRLLGAERRTLRANNDLPALERLIPMLQQWAAAAGGGWLGASALGEAAEIAELDLRNTARAEELRSEAIATGRTASGTPIPLEGPSKTTELDIRDLRLPEDDSLTGEIAHAEHVLESDSSPERVRELAELYARRDGEGDRQNAAQLYCTLGEMLGNPAGVPMLERAIALIPEHAEAKALLMRYAVRPRRVSSPKITLLGAATSAAPQPPPPAAAGLSAPKLTPAVPMVAVAPPPPAARALAPLQGSAIAAQPTVSVNAPVPQPGLSGSLTAKTAAGAALSNAAARISSRPPAARSSRPPGRRSSTSPGYVTAATASALAADDHAIPLETVAAESMPPLAVAAEMPPLTAAVAQEAAESHESVAKVVLPDLEPANDLTEAAPDVLQLHGVPQVKTVPPSVPEISSLSPYERSDASELALRRSARKKRMLIGGGIALSAAAAFGIFFSSASSPDTASVQPKAAAAKTVAAVEPQKPEPEPEKQPAAEPAAPPEPEAKEEVAAAEAEQQPSAATAVKPEEPAPAAPKGSSHAPQLKLDAAKQKGSKLNDAQLAQALSKAEPKLLACYSQAIEHKPKLKGKVLYSFTIAHNGKASAVKRASGTLKDDALTQCSTKVLETIKFPKPKKSTQIKLSIQYKRS